MPDKTAKILPLETTDKRITYVTLAILAVLLLWVGLCYYNSLDGEFVYDDGQFVTNNAAIKTLESPWRFLYQKEAYARTGTFNIYRPLGSLSFAISYHFSKLNPLPYHAVSYVGHLINVVLLFFLLRFILRSDYAAGVAALLFAVHPRNVEVVSWIAQRSSILFMFFFLVGFHCHLRSRRGGRAGFLFGAGSVLAYALSLLAKEMAITYPALLLVCDLLLGGKLSRAERRHMIRYYLALGLVAIVYLFVRSSVLGGAVAQRTWQGRNIIDNTLYAFNCIAAYAVMIFWTLKPLALSINYPFPQVVTKAPLVAGVSFALVVVMLVGIIRFRKRYRVISFGLAWFLVTTLPISNIIPIKTTVNDRFLYLPMVGLVICVGWLMVRLWGHFKTRLSVVSPSLAILLILFGLLSAQTVLRNRDWHDQQTLFMGDLQKYPEDAQLQAVTGVLYLGDDQVDKAIDCLEKTLEQTQEQTDPRVVSALAQAHLRKGNHQRADYLLNLLLSNIMKPGTRAKSMALEKLGGAYLFFGRQRQAMDAFAYALKQTPNLLPRNAADIMNNLARIYVTSPDAKLHNHEKGLELATRAVSKQPDNTHYLDTLAHALEANGKFAEAVKVVGQVLQLLPKDSPDRKFFTDYLQKLKRKSAASVTSETAD